MSVGRKEAKSWSIIAIEETYHMTTYRTSKETSTKLIEKKESLLHSYADSDSNSTTLDSLIVSEFEDETYVRKKLTTIGIIGKKQLSTFFRGYLIKFFESRG
jgi:hypothetical protein